MEEDRDRLHVGELTMRVGDLPVGSRFVTRLTRRKGMVEKVYGEPPVSVIVTWDDSALSSPVHAGTEVEAEIAPEEGP